MNIPKDIFQVKKKPKKSILPQKILFTDNDEIPDRIIVYLSEKINLDPIDKTIEYKFSQLRENLKNNKLRIQALKDKLKKTIIQSERREIERLLFEEKDFIEDIENQISLDKYRQETRELLKNYDNDVEEAIRYLQIASNYINIEIIKKVEDNIKCNGCQLDLKENVESFDGIYICPECNCINNYIKPIKYVKDSEHFLMNVGDDDINNFIKVLSKFEGKNVSPIPDTLYSQLDEYFLTRDMREGDYYKRQPHTDEGKKKGTSKKKMWSALEELGYNQYYDEINYITHVYWGWKLPDLTLYRDQIIKDYQITQQVWQRIKKDYKRSASLGTSFRLLSHLRAVDYPYCKREDFKIQDMVESLRLHNDAWRRMCEETGVKYYAIN